MPSIPPLTIAGGLNGGGNSDDRENSNILPAGLISDFSAKASFDLRLVAGNRGGNSEHFEEELSMTVEHNCQTTTVLRIKREGGSVRFGAND